MGKHLQVPCPECTHVVRSNNLTRHLRTHARRTIIAEIKVDRKFKQQTLRQQLFRIIGEEKLNELLHVFHRTDCYAEGKSVDSVNEKFTTKENLACTCGIALKECPHPHRHLLGTFNGTGNHYSRAMTGVFTEKKSFMARKLHGKSDGTLFEKIKQIKHFLHTSCYIQTKRGWHKKLGHENPNTFQNIEEKNVFLAEIYSDWLWAQVTYMRDLTARMERIENKKIFGNPTTEKLEKYQKEIEYMDDRLQSVEARWGEEHRYTDKEIEDDLALFIAECKKTE
jgi:hypothetical protein